MKNLFGIITVFILFISCNQDGKEPLPDISTITVDYNMVRFEQELFSLDTSAMKPEADALRHKYPAFYNLFFKRVLPLKDESDVVFYNNIKGFISDSMIVKLKDTTSLIFSDFDRIHSDFDKAFKYLTYYFPDISIPNIYTYISEYSFQRFVFNDVNNKDGIGVGLDMFLGSEYPYKQIEPDNPVFSAYLTRSFNKEHVVKKTTELVIDEMLRFKKGNRLLDYMINNGKKLYIMDRILPFVNDTVIMEYSEEQLEWCKANELEIWSFLFKEDLFYKTDLSTINKYINASPHSPGMPPSAPGRTANFMGWQIVKSYMKRFPETTLQELIALDDAQQLLADSKYKPKQRS